jgi:hypothetical protein
MESSLIYKALKKIVSFFETQKIPYFVIGGLAAGIMGEPRFTYDIDITILLKESDFGIFLKRLKKASFKFNSKEAILSLTQFGSFRFFYKNVQIDVIIASTKLEDEAMKRKKKIKFLGQSIFCASPEDLILFKLIAGRPKDILDAESIRFRQIHKLDKRYLKYWAKKLSKESQSTRITDGVHRLLGRPLSTK